MLTESRGIFINNLNYGIDDAGLKHLLSCTGKPLESKVHKDSNGKSKGIATATYATMGEAQYAVDRLNNVAYMNMTLKVRLDKEATPVGPVIANGSNVYKVGNTPTAYRER